MCKKQTSVSHSSTEAAIVSLDAGVCMDVIPALGLWDLVIEVFHSESNNTDGRKRELWRDPSAVVKPTMHNSIQSSTPTTFQETLTTFHPTQCILVLVQCCLSLRTSNQNDYQRSKSHNEACFTDPQSYSGLVV